MTLPSYIAEGGKTYRPSLIIWIDVATEMVLGASAIPPQDALAAAGANLRDTARNPKAGSPVMPGRVRVATPELAEALRASIDGVEVVCAPTPELDRAIDSLREHLARNDEESDLHYLRADVTAEGTAAMFRAAARLYEARPWDVIPADNRLIGVTSESLGLRDAVVSVIGQRGQGQRLRAVRESLADGPSCRCRGAARHLDQAASSAPGEKEQAQGAASRPQQDSLAVTWRPRL